MKRIIALTGMPGSGKSTAADILRREGLQFVSMGDAVRKEMAGKGIPIDNVSLRNYALEIRKKFGDDYVLDLVKKDIAEKMKSTDVIILDGLRNILEAEELKKEGYEVLLLGIIADKMLRYERILKRNRESDPHSFRDFEWREQQELKFGVSQVIALSDIYIFNNSTMDYFKEGLTDIFKKLNLLKV